MTILRLLAATLSALLRITADKLCDFAIQREEITEADDPQKLWDATVKLAVVR